MRIIYKKKAEGGHFEELKEDYDVAVKASMYYWEIKKLNGYASLGIGEKQINKVGEIINGTNPPNEKEKRIKFVNKANEILK